MDLSVLDSRHLIYYWQYTPETFDCVHGSCSTELLKFDAERENQISEKNCERLLSFYVMSDLGTWRFNMQTMLTVFSCNFSLINNFANRTGQIYSLRNSIKRIHERLPLITRLNPHRLLKLEPCIKSNSIWHMLSLHPTTFRFTSFPDKHLISFIHTFLLRRPFPLTPRNMNPQLVIIVLNLQH